MTNFLRMTAATAALLLAATPALAAPTNATTNAQATAKIVKPLAIASTQNMDLGTITLTSTASATVGYVGGAWTCPTGMCSGTPQPAKYKITGLNNAQVKIFAPSVSLSTGGTNPSYLTMNLDLPGTAGVVNLGNSGQAGTEFAIGGSVTVDGATVDGTYTGQLNVSAEYQ